MVDYSERTQQAEIRTRIGSRDNGFVRMNLTGDETIPAMLARQVALHPRRTAVVSCGRSVTYEELQRLANTVGQSIRECLGGERAPVALLVSDTARFAASMLGILQAGAAYVPLDPAFPAERNSRILQQLQARCIVTETSHQDLVQRLAPPGSAVLYVDELAPSGAGSLDCSHADDLACVVFTSGSTGRPKGVMQTHQNILQVVRRYTHSLCLGFEDRVSLLSSCSVTASVGTILGSLLNGATLCAFAVRDQGLMELAEWLDTEGITIYRSVPSLFRHLMQSVARQRIFPSVQIVRLGGDSLHKSDWQLFTEHFSPQCVFVNFYGCSEMSTAACFYMNSGSRLNEGVLPVGYPLDDVDIAIVRPDGIADWLPHEPPDHTAAAVTSAEIVLKSRYLSPGYWRDDAATDAAFDPCDWVRAGVRCYRTGDVGAIRNEQGLVHVGRADSQVKVSGFRVEIAEVEACLRRCEAVREAAVTLHSPSHGERELVGFVTANPDISMSGSDIRTFVAARLPAHMVPSEIMLLDEIPSTPNGKVDRAALLQLRQLAWEAKVRIVPSSRDEQLLAEIWQEILNVERVGRDDNFFELGGNSVLGLKLAARLVERFVLPLRALTVFQYPTIARMAQHMESLRAHGERQDFDSLVMEEGRI